MALTGGSDVQAQEGKKKAPRAAPTVSKKLNADLVDNFHASASPKQNRLLALDANSKFPDSVIPDSIQRRVSGTCSTASGIQEINADGTVNCGVGESAIAAGTWNLTGNAATNPASDFVGTTDNQPLVFRTNNAERLRILGNGNVGIGTANPLAGYKLEVNGATLLTPGGSGGKIYLSTPNGETGMMIIGANRADVRFDGSRLRLVAGTGVGAPPPTNGIVVDTNGRVGIGTTAPNQTLEVNGVTSMGAPGSVYGYRLGNAAGPYFPTLGFNAHGASYLAGSAGYGGILQFQNGDGKLIYYTGSNVGAGAAHVNTARFSIIPNGNVGIGTTTPAQTLEVNGVTSMGLAGGVYGYRIGAGPYFPTLGFNAYGSAYQAGTSGYGGILQFQNGDGKLIYYTGSNAGAGGAHANTPRMAIDANGNVGIGTTSPNALFSVVKSGAPQPIVQGVATGVKVGTPSGTIPLALRQNALESGNPTLAYFETSSGDLGYLGANAGAFVVGASANKALAFNVNGSTRAMSIASNGVVGIGTANIEAKLHVRGQPNLDAFRVDRSDGTNALRVTHDGYVGVYLLGNTHSSVCHGGGILSSCHSAAEYVPTIDGGLGFPQDTDLVSISSTNPYGDTHRPFAVQRSTTACDPNLLGFIADPALGADGTKLNDHYLPLAIYGYFAAKVSMENGTIKRGDPSLPAISPAMQ